MRDLTDTIPCKADGPEVVRLLCGMEREPLAVEPVEAFRAGLRIVRRHPEKATDLLGALHRVLGVVLARGI